MCSFASVLASTCVFGAYVTDGLVLRYDAIDNTGVGGHSDSPSVWADLSGNGHDLTLPATGLTVGADTITFDHVSGSVSGISCLTDANGNANAFDDAAFYFRGARQAVNSYLDDYEFANALYAGSAANPAGDTFKIDGARTNVMVETMDVPAPYAGKTLRNRSVVHFTQPYTTEEHTSASTSFITINQPVAATNRASYTVMLRFKVESRVNPAADAEDTIHVLQLGYSYSRHTGVRLQLFGPKDNLYVRAYHGSNADEFKDMQTDSTKTLKIGDWVDWAAVYVNMDDSIAADGAAIMRYGVKRMDALHLASAKAAGCDWFLTTDRGILKHVDFLDGMRVANPVDFAMEDAL